jgi:hypothetical protein
LILVVKFMEGLKEQDIDEICSIKTSHLQECTTALLHRLAKELEIEGHTTMDKEQLCKRIRQTISLANSEKLIHRCDKLISGLELLYDPVLHGKDIGFTIQQLRTWYNNNLARIRQLKGDRSRQSVMALSEIYANINSQCRNLVDGIIDQALAYSRTK